MMRSLGPMTVVGRRPLGLCLGAILLRCRPGARTNDSARGRRIACREAVLARLIHLLVLGTGHYWASTSVPPAARRIAIASARRSTEGARTDRTSTPVAA